MLFWGIFWALLAVIFAGGIVGMAIYIIRLKTRDLPPQRWGQLKLYGRSIGFWGFWGGIFGAIGAAVLMRFTGVPRAEVLPWILFGVAVGLLWGAFWGVFWQITSRP